MHWRVGHHVDSESRATLERHLIPLPLSEGVVDAVHEDAPAPVGEPDRADERGGASKLEKLVIHGKALL